MPRLMARPWEYPRWRRVLMQVAMWVVFLAGLGLAHVVVRQRQLMPIALEPPTRLGPLWVRLPQGWIQTSSEDPNGGVIQAEDPDQAVEVRIMVQHLADQKGGLDVDQPGAGTQPIYFKGLKQPGVMAGLQQHLRTPEGVVVPKEIMLAMTDLPSGYEVEILVAQGGGNMGAGERKLLETVADGITWAGPLPPTRRLPPLPQGPIQVY